MEAILLAGGFGTRLKTVVNDVPKPMAPINNIPFLSYILESLYQAKFTRILLSVGYLADKIKDTYGNSYKTISLVYCTEKEALGTGGAIRYAMQKAKERDVFVLNGDTFFEVNYLELLNYHRERDANITIAVKKMENFNRYGTIEYNNTFNVTKFNEKQPLEKGYINAGVYVMSVEYMNSLSLPTVFSLEKNVLEQYYWDDMIVYDTDCENYFIDIGIPEDYNKAQDELNRYIKFT